MIESVHLGVNAMALLRAIMHFLFKKYMPVTEYIMVSLKRKCFTIALFENPVSKSCLRPY